MSILPPPPPNTSPPGHRPPDYNSGAALPPVQDLGTFDTGAAVLRGAVERYDQEIDQMMDARRQLEEQIEQIDSAIRATGERRDKCVFCAEELQRLQRREGEP